LLATATTVVDIGLKPDATQDSRSYAESAFRRT
jgi:hypothetical protein